MTKKFKRFTAIGSVVLIAMISTALVLLALDRSISYFYTPSELHELDQYPSTPIRVGGLVALGSVSRESAVSARIDFIIEDGAAHIPVSFDGILPDLFREGQGVIVQGSVDKDGRLIASEVLAKHDENYMPKEISDSLKKSGQWKGDSNID